MQHSSNINLYSNSASNAAQQQASSNLGERNIDTHDNRHTHNRARQTHYAAAISGVWRLKRETRREKTTFPWSRRCRLQCRLPLQQPPLELELELQPLPPQIQSLLAEKTPSPRCSRALPRLAQTAPVLCCIRCYWAAMWCRPN
jgi:hypothetical protein